MYPINLDLTDKPVLLIGAGSQMARKLHGLIESGARVTVIAPSADAEILQQAELGYILYHPRPYQPGDLQGAFLVMACTQNPTVHAQVLAEAEANGQLVNIVDTEARGNFHNASVVRQGLLTLTISTNGASPALAAILKKQLAQQFGPEYAEFLAYAQTLRPLVVERIPYEQRKAFWYALIEGGAISLLRHGKRVLFEGKVALLLNQYGRKG